MVRRTLTALMAAAFLFVQGVPGPALAENQMGYRLLSAQEASGLPRRGGAVGLALSPAQQITDGGMTFAVLRVSDVRRGSPGAQAGLKAGDMIIAADGRVFPSVAAFSSYVGSRPGEPMSVDYIPARGGPKDAQRVAVRIGPSAGAAPAAATEAPQSTGLSTGAKVAIGVGAAALFGCYKFGCFSRKRTGASTQPAPAGLQPR